MPEHQGKRLTHLAQDPDQRWRRSIWLIWAGTTVVLVGAWLAAPVRDRADAIPWLMKAPLIGLYLLWPLWRAAGLIVSRLRDSPLAPWQGSYYEFDNAQIRVLVDDGDRLLIAASDVLDALHIKGRDRQPDRIRAIVGPEGLVFLPGTRQPFFTESGLQQWLGRSSRRDVARFTHWLRTQVCEPHRRRQERGTRR
jgi:hypothetical protein